jgi:protein tyrosine phosphatase (PTP) superfamily phosphohydrolase (DUF442 family)
MRCSTATFLVLIAACSAPPQPTTLTLAQLQATEVPNIALPAPNLVTAGQPTAAQLAQLVQLGVQRIVCLRPATEPGTGWEEAKALAFGKAAGLAGLETKVAALLQ